MDKKILFLVLKSKNEIINEIDYKVAFSENNRCQISPDQVVRIKPSKSYGFSLLAQ